MVASHYPRIIRCTICGTDVFTTAARCMCQECREETIREHNRKRYAYRRAKPPVLIVYDPIRVDDGGFRQGAGMTVEELHTGLCMQSFEPGMIVAIHGKKKVVRQSGTKQKLEEIYD